MIWIISTLLWYEDMVRPRQSDYLLKTFDSHMECQYYIKENKVILIEKLLEEMKNVNGFELKTFEYLCKSKNLTEV